MIERCSYHVEPFRYNYCFSVASLIVETCGSGVHSRSRSAKRAKTSTGAASSSQGPDGDTGGDGDDDVSGEEEHGGGVVLADGDVDRIFQELDDKRAEWEDQYGAEQLEDFKSGLFGGAGTFRASSVVADNVCCEAHSRDAKDFVQKYGLNASKRANIETYGMHNATVIVSAWGHKMQFYLDLFRRSGDEMYEYTAADHRCYQEPEEFTKVVASGPKVEAAARAIRVVMPFFPKKA